MIEGGFKVRFLMFSGLLIFLLGCQTLNVDNEDALSTEQMTNQGKIESKPDPTGYQQSKRRLKNFGKTKNKQIKDEYVNQRTRDITNYLKAKDDIYEAQVAETADRIIVGVILSDYAEKDMADELAKDVKRLIKDNKAVVVYTDYTYWYERIDRDASEGATELGNVLENMFDGFFDIAD